PVDGEDGAVPVGAQVAGGVVGAGGGVGGVGGHGDLGLAGQASAPVPVDAHHGPAGVLGGQQQPFGPVVLLHVAVEVEMVLAEVGEAGDVDDDLVGPMQHQGMGGDLHGGGLHAVL